MQNLFSNNKAKERIENVHDLAVVFMNIAHIKAFCTSKNKKPQITSLDGLVDLNSAIERCRAFGYSVDISIYLNNINVSLFERDNVKLCFIDIDERTSNSLALVKAFRNKCYIENSKGGYHCFCYTDKTFYTQIAAVELFTSKFARLTADMLAENSIPFFLSAADIIKRVKQFYHLDHGRLDGLRVDGLRVDQPARAITWLEAKNALIASGQWIFIKEDTRREYYKRRDAKTNNHDACYDKSSNRFQVYSTSTPLFPRSYFPFEIFSFYKKQVLL